MITLVLGGASSGKSAAAERLAADAGDHVTYLATALLDPTDADHAARIERHRARRPASWAVREVGADLASALDATSGPVLVDSLGTWITAHPDLEPDIGVLIASLRSRRAPTVLVSEEVGLSVHPPTELGRRFQEAVGAVNLAVSAVADRALLVVAGRVLELPDVDRR
ncbi:MAG: bifunctional adenosylcobinamide kinase/adenosylcobinamide-phosphate guanylyltransferase [Actinomycetota bacterium]